MRLRCVVAALILLAGFASDSLAQSKRPPPDRNQTQRADQPPAADQRGTTQSPAIVKVLPPEDTEAKSKQEADDRAAKDRLDTNTIRLGIAAIIVAFLQFVGICIQAWFLWGTLKVTAEAAKAATTAANHIPQVERAYVFATPLPEIENGKTIITLKCQNFGQTPAIITEGYGATSNAAPDGQPLYPPGDRNPRFIDAVLGKDSSDPFPTRWWHPTTEPHFFYGYIRYMDIFRETHITRFCVKVFPSEGRVDLAGPSIWNSWN